MRLLLNALGALGLAGLPMAQAGEPIPYAPGPIPALSKDFPSHDGPAWPDHTDSKKCWKLYGGADALYLRPHFNSNPALTVLTTNDVTTIGTGANGLPAATVNNSSTTSTRDFSYDFSVTPRYWIGIQTDSGLGLRGRYFRFDQDADPISATSGAAGFFTPAVVGLPGGIPNNIQTSVTSTPALGQSISTSAPSTSTAGGGITTFLPGTDTLSARSSLHLDVWDGEVTQSFGTGCWQIQVSAGGRYTFIEQTYGALHAGPVRTDSVGGVITARDQTSDSLSSRHTFTGGGPTMALEVLRRLGNSNIGLYSNARGSLLFGRSRQSVTTRSDISSDVIIGGATLAAVNNTIVNNAQTDSFDVLPVLELEAGTQWAAPLGKLEFIIRSAAVGQVYLNGGNATSRDGDFGLFGATLSAGLRF
jgi:hypothetical protein